MNNFLERSISLFIANLEKDMVKVGQPSFFLWSSDEAALFEEPTWFIYKNYVQRGSSPSVHTWSAVGYDLLTWFQYLLLEECDWRDARELHRKKFADDYSSAISPSGKEYEDASINRKLTNIREFYWFAGKQGWYFGDIGSDVETVQFSNLPIDTDPLAHTRSPGGRVKEKDKLLRKIGRKDVIRPLQAAELRKLVNYLGPSTSSGNGDMRRVRDRLIIDCGWVSGLRLNDVINLTTLKFLSIIVESGQELQDFPIIVEKSKGKVTRLASFPGWLIKDIQEYIATERAEAEKLIAKQRRSTQLFLAHFDSKSAGRPISRNAIQKMFNKACMACGIIESKEWVDPESGETHIKVVSKNSYHDLRHNCAVLTYHAEKALGNAEPWKVVQIKLGHKSLKVTMDTYLAHVEIFGKKQGVVDMRKVVGLA